MKNLHSTFFGILAATIASALTVSAATYNITDLGPGSASDINDSGRAVGLSDGGQVIYYNGAAVTYPTLFGAVSWGGDEPPLLGAQVRTIRINNQGYLGAAVFSYGVIYTNLDTGIPSNIGAPVAFEMVFNDVGGWAVGSQSVFYAPYTSLLSSGQSCNGEMRAINNHGDAAGYFQAYATDPPAPRTGLLGLKRAVILGTNGMVRLDLRDASDFFDRTGLQHTSEAFGINNAGHVCGQMTTDADLNANHAFIHRGNGLEDLGTFGGTNSTALDINDSDAVVGNFVKMGGSSAFLWQKGAGIDLNTVLPDGSGWVLTSANAVNSRGQIVGEGTYQGATHAFLLSPVSPPQISLQPLGTSLTIGQAYQLQVGVVGSGPLAYQWQKDGTNVPGQTNAILPLVGSAAVAGSYRVIISSVGGNETSLLARIDVLDAKLTIAPAASAGYALTVIGEAGGNYRLEYAGSPDGTGGWTPLANFTLTNAVQVYTDTTVGSATQRYYRGVRLP